jgi:N,N-dimethylformamidase
MLNTVAVIGYAAPIEVARGSTVEFKLSSATLTSARAQIVKIRCGDPDPSGPGVQLIAMPSPLDGEVALTHQPIHAGSCGLVDDAPVLRALGSFSIGCWVWPTLLDAGAQTVVARWREDTQEGWRLGLDAQGRASFAVAVAGHTCSATASRALLEREWAFIGASYDATSGQLAVFQHSLDVLGGRDRSASDKGSAPRHAAWPAGLPLSFAAHLCDDGTQHLAAAHFNGKIDRPRLHAGVHSLEALRASAAALRPARGDADLVAAWDFSEGIGSDRIVDRGPHGLHGVLRNAPTRAVTGANWNARTPHWTEATEEYGAIHFHNDDIDDCRWNTNLSLDIPTDWPSGFYSLRLRATDTDGQPAESHVPFFVGAQPGQARARLAFVASTATFLAYSNSAIRLDLQPTEAMLEQLLVLGPDDAYLQEHRELGLSTYDTHSDGSGWCYASAARPILNMRPHGGGYYQMDTRVIDWLDSTGISYDVITDSDIHRHGAQLLAGYGCVLTGCHPEYYTQQMLDAFETYQAGGGRHVYLGGNGFYWRTAFHPTKPGRIEIRRGLTGTRTWEGEPGENGLSSTGEPSGLWRSNGRPPQRLVGVGFDAQVFDRGCAYRRLPDSLDPRVAFIFEGVGEQEVIGDFGLRGGAGGHEIDRVDTRLGSPPHLLRVATADDFGSGGLATPEEFGVSHRGLGGDQNNQIRADMTFFPTARGGAVFTTGSIAWGMALAHRGYDNNVSRITANVLRRFIDPAPFTGFGASDEEAY